MSATQQNRPGPPCTPSPETAELFRRWLDLSELNRRAFAAMAEEIGASGTLVETSIQELSERFQLLAVAAVEQSSRMNDIIAVAQSVTVDGENLSLGDVTTFIENLLGRVINLMVTLSKHAMTMVYTLDDVSRDVAAAESCIARIDGINRQTRFLALNATIEAERASATAAAGAGGAGGAFRVIAGEVKDLSSATDDIARAAQKEIASVASGVRRSHTVLRQIATLDLSEHIMARDRLARLVQGLVQQSQSVQSVLADTARSSSTLAGLVSSLTTGIQFQDRASQQLQQVSFTLGVLGDAASDLQRETLAASPALHWAGGPDQAWQHRILAGRTLSEARGRFLARLLNGTVEDQPPPAAANDAGSVDLF